MVQMNYLNEAQRPQSNDPNYWETWTAPTAKHKADWRDVARVWQSAGQKAENEVRPIEEAGAADDGDDVLF